MQLTGAEPKSCKKVLLVSGTTEYLSKTVILVVETPPGLENVTDRPEPPIPPHELTLMPPSPLHTTDDEPEIA